MRHRTKLFFFAIIPGLCCYSHSKAAAPKLDSAQHAAAVPDNPVAFTKSSIGKGKQLFSSHCISCHGDDGKGSTAFREFLKTPPADLTDKQWIYGGRDSDIFDVTKNGRAERDMPAFGKIMNDERIWHVVNYVKYLGGKKP